MELGPKQWEPVVPFYLFFNVMLWILLVLNIYWFAVSIHHFAKIEIENFVTDLFVSVLSLQFDKWLHVNVAVYSQLHMESSNR